MPGASAIQSQRFADLPGRVVAASGRFAVRTARWAAETRGGDSMAVRRAISSIRSVAVLEALVNLTKAWVAESIRPVAESKRSVSSTTRLDLFLKWDAKITERLGSDARGGDPIAVR